MKQRLAHMVTIGVIALPPSDELAKPIAQMSDSEIDDWQRSLVDRGIAPLLKRYPHRPDGMSVRFDAVSRTVIEEGVDGIETTLFLRDGKLSRTGSTGSGPLNLLGGSD